MPKQIILEYPWKAVLINGECYYLYEYSNTVFPQYTVYEKSASSVGKYISVEQQCKHDQALKSIITQCQTELNN